MSAAGSSHPQKPSGKVGKDPGNKKKNYYVSKRPVGGRGIFVTCIRGKEKRSLDEFMDLLEETADSIYPQSRLDELALTRAHRPAALGTGPEGPGLAEVSASEDDEDESIEASIARELAELKNSNTKGKGKPSGQPKGPKPRFQSVETSTECLLFIATAWPYDPVELCEAIIRDIQSTAVAHTRFTQRLAPIAISSHAMNVDQVSADSAAFVEKYFAGYVERTGKTDITYQIEPVLRCHSAPLSRSHLLATLGAHIRALSSPPAADSSYPSRPALTLSANLTTPDLVILATVFRNCYGLAIVEGKEWSGKFGRKWNIAEVASEARRRKIEAEGETSVRGMEGVQTTAEVTKVPAIEAMEQ